MNIQDYNRQFKAATVKLTSLGVGEKFSFPVGGDVDIFVLIGQGKAKGVTMLNTTHHAGPKLITLPAKLAKTSRVIQISGSK